MADLGAWGMSSGAINSVAGDLGSTLNLITGKSDSARQQYKYNLRLQQQAQEFAKWQMGNAHQMEIQDLEKAGLNPVLSAGGGGASASVGGGTTGAGAGGTDPIAMIQGLVNSMNSVKQTQASVDNLKAQQKTYENQTEFYKKWGVFPGATVDGKIGPISGKVPVGLITKNYANSGRSVKNKIKTHAKNKTNQAIDELFYGRK